MAFGRMAGRLAAAVALVASAGLTPPAAADTDISGDWRTGDGAIVRIAPCGDAPCGRIVRFPPPPGLSMETTRDRNNRDSSKRNRKVLGLTILWQLAPSGDAWKGRVYDPRRGISAKATVTRQGTDALRLRGCVRVLFDVCETETWRRAR